MINKENEDEINQQILLSQDANKDLEELTSSKNYQQQQQILQQFFSENFRDELEQKKINKYLLKIGVVLEGFIAEGGEGAVFKGVYQNENVAVKFIKQIDIEQIEKYRQIIKSYYNGFNIAKTYRYIIIPFPSQKDLLIEVQEFCKSNLSEELKQFINQKKFYSFTQLLKLIFDLFDALVELSSLNIFHSDIKPSNILINSKNSYVFCDFGVSQYFSINKQIQVLGFTVGYSAPEQQQNQQFDSRTDLYNLGKTLERVIKLRKEQLKQINIEEDNIRNKQEDILISVLEKFITKNFLNYEIQKRMQVQDIHVSLLKELKSFLTKEFIVDYLSKIKNMILFYRKNQDQYQNKITEEVYYKVCIQIQKIITNKIPQNYYFQSNIDMLLIQGDTCTAFYNFDQAKSYYQKYQQILIQSEKNCDNNFLVYKKIGYCYYKLGQFKKALGQFLISLYIILQQQDKEDNQKIICKLLSYIGKSYLQLANYDLSYQYFIQSQKQRIEFFPNNSFETAIAFDELGDLYLEARNYEQSSRLYKDSYLIKQEYRNEIKYVKSFLYSMNCLGKVRILLKQYEEGFKLLEQCKKLREQLKFTTDIDYALLLQDIGQYYLAKENNVSKGQRYFLHCLEIINAKIKQENYIKIDPIRNIAFCLYLKGQIEISILIYLIILHQSKKYYENDHPRILQQLEDIAQCFMEAGYYSLSIYYYNQILPKQQQNKGYILYRIAICYQKLGIHKKAKNILEQCIKMNQNSKFSSRIHLALNESIMQLMNNQDINLEFIKETNNLVYQEYFQNVKQNLSTIQEQLEDLSLRQLFTFYDSKIKQAREKLDIFHEILDTISKKYRKRHPHQFKLIYIKSLIYLLQNNIDQQLAALNQCLEIRNDTFKTYIQQIPLDISFRISNDRMIEQHFTILKFFIEDIQLKLQTKNIGKAKSMIKTLNSIAYCCKKLGSFQLSIHFYKNAFYMTKEIQLYNKLDFQIYLFFEIGDCYANLKLFNKAIKFYLQLLVLVHYIPSFNLQSVGIIKQKIGICYLFLGYKQLSILYLLNSLDYPVNEQYQAISMSYLGLIYYQIGEYKLSQIKFQEYLEIFQQFKKDDQIQLSQSFINICKCYHSFPDKNEIYIQLKDILREMVINNQQLKKQSYYLNIGICYLYLKQNQNALEFFKKNLDYLGDILPDKHIFIAETYKYIGKYYEQIEDYQQSLNYYLKSKDIHSSIQFCKNAYLLDLFKRIGNIYQIIGEYNQALIQYKKYLLILNSIKQDYVLDNKFSFILKQIGLCYLRQKQYQRSIFFFFIAFVYKLLLQDNRFKNFDYENISFLCLIAHSLKCLKHFELANKFYQFSNLQIEDDNIQTKLYLLENIAYCYSRLSDQDQSIAYYQICKQHIQELIDQQQDFQVSLENQQLRHKKEKSIIDKFYQINIQEKFNNIILTKSLLNTQVDFEQFLFLKEKKEYYSLYKLKEQHALYSNNIGYCYHLIKDQKALQYLEESYQLLSQNQPLNTFSMAFVQFNLGNFFYSQKQFQKSQFLMEEVVKKVKMLDSQNILIFQASNIIGACNYRLGYVQEALQIYLQNVPQDYKSDENIKLLLFSYYSNIGACYLTLGNNSKALEYLKLAKQHK